MLGRLRCLGTADFWYAGRRTWYGSLGASLAAHLTALTVMATIWMAPRVGDGMAALLDGGWAPPAAPLEALEQFELPRAAEAAFTPTVGGARSGDVVPRSVLTPQALSRSLTRAEVSFGSPSDDVWTDDALTAKVGPLRTPKGESDAPGNGEGTGEGDGTGDGGSNGFFGIRTSGRRFVYVVDCSGSMARPYFGPGKTRCGRMKLEIVKSVEAMRPDQEFFIIYFNHAALPMPADRPVAATPDAQKKYLKWMNLMLPHGDTDPTTALALALRMQPDVIYFLTDGMFPTPCILWLNQLQQTGTAIHTFAFGDPVSEHIMKSLAARNRGEYHFIPAETE